MGMTVIFSLGQILQGPQATYLTVCSAWPMDSQLRLSPPRRTAMLPPGPLRSCLGAFALAARAQFPVAPTSSLSAHRAPDCHVEPPPPPAAAPCLTTGPLHLSLAVSHLPPRCPGMPAACPAAFPLLQQFRPMSGPSECLWSDGRNGPRALDRVEQGGVPAGRLSGAENWVSLP